jgi:hypothetical protein
LLKGFDLKMLHPGARRAFIEEGILWYNKKKRR